MAYAPKTDDDYVGRDSPPTQHADLDTHHMVTLLVVTIVVELLRDAGIPSKAVSRIWLTAWDAA